MRTQIGHRILGVLLAVALTGTSQPADAQDAAVASEEPRVRITKKDCQRVVRHRPDAGVAYQPGVDVRGNPVAPADADGGVTLPLPDVFEFNVTKDLSGYLDGPEEQLAANKAAAIAADKSVTATDAAVTSAVASVESAQSVYDDAVTAAQAAQAAADAAPNDAALASAAETAAAEAEAAAAGLNTAETAYQATESAATSDDVTGAASAAQSTLAAAEATAAAAGLDEDAVATATEDASTATETAQQAATDAAAADTAALQAAETVAKSTGMTLNVGTIRYNINTGAMTFNGKPLTSDSEAELAALCRQFMSDK